MYNASKNECMNIEEILMKLNTCFFMKDNKLLEKYNEIWDKVGNTIKPINTIEPSYNEKYLKTKMKS